MDVPTLLDFTTAYGFETDDELTDDRKVEAINEAYNDICTREAWPFLEGRDSNASIVSATGGVLTLSNTDTIRTVKAIYVGTSGGAVRRTLEPQLLEDIFDSAAIDASILDTQGDPQWYYFLDETIYCAPPPAADVTGVNVFYLKSVNTLTATSAEAEILIPPRWHRSVLGIGTLMRLAMMQDDVDMANAYERVYEKALAYMVDAVFDRQNQRTQYIHVNDPDNWDYE